MFENPTNLETNLGGTYLSPIVMEDRMTTLDEVKQFTRDKNPEVNKEVMENILARQEIVEVKYLSKDNKLYLGKIVVDKDLANDVAHLFEEIERINNNATADSEKFFIEKIIPISSSQYEGDDEKSMQDNNTSALNFRNIKNTLRLSLHAFGFAIDINPRDNPLVEKGKPNQPSNGVYDEQDPNTLTASHKIVNFMRQRGFEWGGEWEDLKGYKDFQHFEKVIPTKEYIENYLKNVVPSFEFELKDEEGREKIKKSVIDKINRLIINNNIDKPYTDNLGTLIDDPQIKNILGEDHASLYLYLRPDLGDQF